MDSKDRDETRNEDFDLSDLGAASEETQGLSGPNSEFGIPHQ